MHAEIDGERTLTELDFARLNKLGNGHWPAGLAAVGQFPDLVASAEIAPGTLSIPDVPQGWQRSSRASVIQPPAHRPKRPMASSP